jgi:type IV pilus assembly protein PilX
MNRISKIAPRRQRGIALMAAILILLIITILGMAMFRSYGMQQRIGGNTRDKARAFHSAMAGESYAEWFLTGNNGSNALATKVCTGVGQASPTAEMVCSNIIPTTVAQPDTWGAAFTYNPGNNMNTTPGAFGSYAKLPQFYISSLGSPTGGSTYKSPIGQTQAMFQIDAAGWGGTPQTLAVVESSYIVSSTATTIPPSSSGQVQKTIFLSSQQ